MLVTGAVEEGPQVQQGGQQRMHIKERTASFAAFVCEGRWGLQTLQPALQRDAVPSDTQIMLLRSMTDRRTCRRSREGSSASSVGASGAPPIPSAWRRACMQRGSHIFKLMATLNMSFDRHIRRFYF